MAMKRTMSWKVTAASVLTFGLGWCLSAVEEQCIRQFNEDLSNDFLEGTWYRIIQFTLFGNPIPSSECPTFNYSKPNATELARYKAEYLKPDTPFSFADTPIHHDGGRLRPLGLTIGNKQAKFFIMDPNTHFFRPPFLVRIYQRLSNDLILFHECSSRGHVRWLMSRNRSPSREEVDAVLKTRPEIANMWRQWYCV